MKFIILFYIFTEFLYCIFFFIWLNRLEPGSFLLIIILKIQSRSDQRVYNHAATQRRHKFTSYYTTPKVNFLFLTCEIVIPYRL